MVLTNRRHVFIIGFGVKKLELLPSDKFFLFYFLFYNLAILALILAEKDLFWLVFALSLNEIDPIFFSFLAFLCPTKGIEPQLQIADA